MRREGLKGCGNDLQNRAQRPVRGVFRQSHAFSRTIHHQASGNLLEVPDEKCNSFRPEAGRRADALFRGRFCVGQRPVGMDVTPN
jgi:hypothetical protein